jgi:hypothetical protein
MDNLRENLCTFMITSGWIFVGMKSVSDKRCGETQNTHFMIGIFFLNRAFHETMWKLALCMLGN